MVLQRGHTVWVSRRGELWKCNAGQVFKLSTADQAGLDLIRAKARLRYDSEKLQYVDASQEVDVELAGPSGGHADAEQPPEPTEVSVSGPSSLYSPDLTDAEQHPEPAEVSVSGPVVDAIDVGSE